MGKNRELDFRKWVLAEMEKRFVTKADAMNSGAELFQCSTLTTRRYLKKLTSTAGPLFLTSRQGVATLWKRSK